MSLVTATVSLPGFAVCLLPWSLSVIPGVLATKFCPSCCSGSVYLLCMGPLLRGPSLQLFFGEVSVQSQPDNLSRIFAAVEMLYWCYHVPFWIEVIFFYKCYYYAFLHPNIKFLFLYVSMYISSHRKPHSSCSYNILFICFLTLQSSVTSCRFDSCSDFNHQLLLDQPTGHWLCSETGETVFGTSGTNSSCL